MTEIRYPVADGPGSGRIVEVTVRVLVGTERSTVIVARGRDPASLHETREHGHEAEGIGAAVEAEPGPGRPSPGGSTTAACLLGDGDSSRGSRQPSTVDPENRHLRSSRA